MTYGDCVSQRSTSRALIDFHRAQGALATLTAIQPPGRFGALALDDDARHGSSSFHEKPDGDGGWVNGGFFVLEPGGVRLHRRRRRRSGSASRSSASRTTASWPPTGTRGYWQNMDSLRDKMVLEEQWASGKPPWKIW